MRLPNVETRHVKTAYIETRNFDDGVSVEVSGAEFDEWLSEVQENARTSGYLEGYWEARSDTALVWDTAYNAGKNDLRDGKPFKTTNPYL